MSAPLTGRWAKRLDRWWDERGPFHLQQDDGSPACGAHYHSMAGPHRQQPSREECCARCLRIHDARERSKPTLHRSAVRRARETARVFFDEFPGQTPDIRWLAEAAAIDRIKDHVRDAWMDEVRAEVERLMEIPE